MDKRNRQAFASLVANMLRKEFLDRLDRLDSKDDNEYDEKS